MFKPVRFEQSDAGSAGGGNADPTPAPSPQGTVPSGTPSPVAPDAGQLELQKFREELAKRERDISNIKSTFQRQLSEQKRQWDQERQKLEEDLRRAQMSSLDDDAKAEFQKNLQLEQAGTWKQQALEYEQKLQEMQAVQNYTQFFIDQGVPVERLVRDQGVETLVQSGWQGVQEIIKDLTSQLDALKSPAPPPTTVTPTTPTPQTRTPISATPAPVGTGPTWEDLIKRYGTAEEVYRMVEAGELPPSIIPVA